MAMLSVTVDENGAVTEVRPRGPADAYGFVDVAAVAARQWKTNPPRAQGKSVKTSFAVDITFSL
jgi:TonB family protein